MKYLLLGILLSFLLGIYFATIKSQAIRTYEEKAKLLEELDVKRHERERERHKT